MKLTKTYRTQTKKNLNIHSHIQRNSKQRYKKEQYKEGTGYNLNKNEIKVFYS